MAKKKHFNPAYTDKMFEAERDAYFHDFGQGRIAPIALSNLSLNFCIRYIERLPDDDLVAKHSRYPKGMTGDGDDYMRWGYALWGEWEEDEEGGGEVHKWIDIYERGLYLKQQRISLYDLGDKYIPNLKTLEETIENAYLID